MSIKVRDIMQSNPVTVSPQDDVECAIRLLREHELSGLPVVNEGGRCVGIVTEGDLIISEEERDFHLPHYIDLLGGVIFLEPFKKFEDRLRKAFAAKVNEMMTADPVTVDIDDDVRLAAKRIVEQEHNRLPVVEHGRLVGVITRLDVIGALHEL